jgi:uncharacterized membrane protein
MALSAVLLAWGLYWLDTRIPNEILQHSLFFVSGSAETQRSSLLTIATTILATAGVVFTLLTLPLSTVATQYGSRLLRLFLGDHVTQFVLGMFVATFVYCLAAAMTIPPVEVHPEGPQLTVLVALSLMLGTFASLILLVQHITTMLQAPKMAAAAGAQLLNVVQADIQLTTSFAVNAAQSEPCPSDHLATAEGSPVYVARSGYIQSIDLEILLTMAQENNLVIRLLCKPGDFVRNGLLVALIWPANWAEVRMVQQVRQALQIGSGRTPTQDIIYAVNQLAEMAMRAMSPAINDPFTAMTCLDYLGDGLALFAQGAKASPCVYDRGGHLRLIFQPVRFDEMLAATFDMLRHAGNDNAFVLLHMLEVIHEIGRELKTTELRQKLLNQVCLIQTESQAGALIDQDRQAISARAEALREALIRS